VVRLHTTGIRNTEEGNTPIVSWAPDGTDDGIMYEFLNLSVKAPESFENTSNILSAKRSRDSSKTFIYNKIIGQTESEMDVYGSLNTTTVKNDRVIESVLKSYKGLKRFKVMDVNSIDYSLWESKKSQIMNNELLQQSRKFESLEYTVAGHSPSGEAPYMVNHVAYVIDKFYGDVAKYRLVYKVEFKGSKDAGRTTVVELCNPSMYEYTADLDTQLKAVYSATLRRYGSSSGKTPSHFEKVN
jgi:prophage tail gpP-like protein